MDEVAAGNDRPTAEPCDGKDPSDFEVKIAPDQMDGKKGMAADTAENDDDR